MLRKESDYAVSASITPSPEDRVENRTRSSRPGLPRAITLRAPAHALLATTIAHCSRAKRSWRVRHSGESPCDWLPRDRLDRRLDMPDRQPRLRTAASLNWSGCSSRYCRRAAYSTARSCSRPATPGRSDCVEPALAAHSRRPGLVYLDAPRQPTAALVAFDLLAVAARGAP